MPVAVSERLQVPPVLSSSDTDAPVSGENVKVESVNLTVLPRVITVGESALLTSDPSITKNLLSAVVAGGL